MTPSTARISGSARTDAHGAPAVSVIVPTRDRLPLLREAVASVLAQSFVAWELIVVDGGSKDATTVYLDTLADPRIRVLEGEHGDIPARLRNLALAAARGRYVAFLDSDDLWEPDKLDVHLARMRAAPRCGWSYSAVLRIDATGRPVPPEGIQPWRACSGRILREVLALEALIATPAVVAERRLIEAVGGFDESLPFCEDYDLWFRLAARADVCAISLPLARVRVHGTHYSADRAGVHRDWVRVYAKAAASLDDPALVALCRARRRDHEITHAALLAGQGARGAAFRQIAGVLARAPLSLRAWRVLGARALLGRPEPRGGSRS